MHARRRLTKKKLFISCNVGLKNIANGNFQVINLNGDGESLKFTPNLASDVADTFLTCESNLITYTFANAVGLKNIAILVL